MDRDSRRHRLGLTARYVAVVIATSVAAGFVVSQVMRADLLDQALSNSAEDTQQVVQSAIYAVLDESEFIEGLTKERRLTLEPVLLDAILERGGTVHYVAFIALDRTIMLTNDRDYVPNWATVDVAFGGRPDARLGDFDGEQAVFHEFPISFGSARVVGVVQVIAEPTDILASTEKQVQRILVLTLGIVGVVQLLALPLLIQAARRLRRQNDRLEESAREYEILATHDPLTGLANRTLYVDRLEQALLLAQRTGEIVGVVIIDINDFKAINDTLGHQAGDHVLQAVAENIQNQMRASDTVARFGGDEFVLLLHGTNGVDEVRAAALRAVDAVGLLVDLDGAEIAVDASAGLAAFPTDGREVGELLRRADVALYSAKDGHDRLRAYDPTLDEGATDQLTVLTDLRPALTSGEIWVAYQPIVDVDSGRAVGLEALLRWDHPTKGSISPASFVAVAERSGLIHELTAFVLTRGLTDLAESGLAARGMYLSVNVSVRDLLGTDLPDIIQHALHVAGLPASALQIEVTETIAMRDPQRAIEALRNIRALGVPVAVDDYGTGHSSLAYLQQLPIQSLKIDRGFVSHLLSRPADLAIVRSTIDLAHNLGILAVAEGVEDEDTVQALRALGCDLLQGYHLARPANLASTLATLTTMREANYAK